MRPWGVPHMAIPTRMLLSRLVSQKSRRARRWTTFYIICTLCMYEYIYIAKARARVRERVSERDIYIERERV